MKMRFLLLAACSSLILGLTACKDDAAADNSPAENKTEAKAPTKESIEDANKRIDAFNAYVSAHNGLSGMFYGQNKGLDNLLDVYKKQNLTTSKKGNPTLYLSTSKLGNALSNLEKAKGISYGELEKTGQELFTIGTELKAKADDLEGYIKSKKYLEDDYAGINQQNDGFVELWTKFNEAYNTFNTVLGQVETEQRIAQIEKLEKDGKMLDAAAERAILVANNILIDVQDNIDFKNEEVRSKTDASIVELEGILATIKSELEKGEGEKGLKQDYEYKRVQENLNTFIGNYRDLKNSKNVSRYNSMVSNYNSAVR